MKLEDVQSFPRRERRSCRANLRLYPSQVKFMEEHDLKVQIIFDKALDELGHVTPAPEDIGKLEREYGGRPTRYRKGMRKPTDRHKKTRGRR